MKLDTSEPDFIKNSLSRESLLKINAQLIATLQKRVNVKRFRPQEGDSIKLGYIRALTQALQVQNSILKDIELDVIKQELEEVRELVKNESCNPGSINGRSK